MDIRKEAEEALDRVRREMTCPACNGPLRDPRLLQCLHSCCHNCLIGLCKKKRIVCPRCKKESVDINVNKLPSDFAKCNLLEAVVLIKGDKICDLCDPSAATSPAECLAVSHCSECSQYLCSFHVASHRRTKTLVGHTLISVDDLKNSVAEISSLKRKIMCSMHVHEKLCLYCATCDETICKDCALYMHKKHDIKYLKDVVPLYRTSLMMLIDHVSEKDDSLVYAISQFEDLMKQLKDSETAAKDEVRLWGRQMHDSLKARGTELSESFEKIATNREEILKEQRAELVRARNVLQQANTHAAASLDPENPLYLCSYYSMLCSSIDRFSKELVFPITPKVSGEMGFKSTNVQEMIRAVQMHGSITAPPDMQLAPVVIDECADDDDEDHARTEDEEKSENNQELKAQSDFQAYMGSLPPPTNERK